MRLELVAAVIGWYAADREASAPYATPTIILGGTPPPLRPATVVRRCSGRCHGEAAGVDNCRGQRLHLRTIAAEECCVAPLLLHNHFPNLHTCPNFHTFFKLQSLTVDK